MPQVSLYLNDQAMDKLRQRAAIQGESLSKYVGSLVENDIDSGWPEGFWDLFGAVEDNAFLVPPELPSGLNVERTR